MHRGILVLIVICPYTHAFMLADVKCPRHILSVFNLILDIHGQFTAAKKGYPLTSATRLYCGLRCTTHWSDTFFKLSGDQLLVLVFLCLSQECCTKVSSRCCKGVNQNEITSHEDDKKVRFSGSRGGAPWVRKFGYLVYIQEILVLKKSESSVRPYVHLFMLVDEKCHTY